MIVGVCESGNRWTIALQTLGVDYRNIRTFRPDQLYQQSSVSFPVLAVEYSLPAMESWIALFDNGRNSPENSRCLLLGAPDDQWQCACLVELGFQEFVRSISELDHWIQRNRDSGWTKGESILQQMLQKIPW